MHPPLFRVQQRLSDWPDCVIDLQCCGTSVGYTKCDETRQPITRMRRCTPLSTSISRITPAPLSVRSRSWLRAPRSEPTSRSHPNASFGADSGPPRGGTRTGGIRPTATSALATGTDRLTSNSANRSLTTMSVRSGEERASLFQLGRDGNGHPSSGRVASRFNFASRHPQGVASVSPSRLKR